MSEANDGGIKMVTAIVRPDKLGDVKPSPTPPTRANPVTARSSSSRSRTPSRSGQATRGPMRSSE